MAQIWKETLVPKRKGDLRLMQPTKCGRFRFRQLYLRRSCRGKSGTFESALSLSYFTRCNSFKRAWIITERKRTPQAEYLLRSWATLEETPVSVNGGLSDCPCTC
jgi:hypothetical protein